VKSALSRLAFKSAGASAVGVGPVPVALTVNGRSVSVRVDPATPLVELLRGCRRPDEAWKPYRTSLPEHQSRSPLDV
jgi:hypothetical protein